VLVVCQFGLETALRAAGALPPNVETRHFNDIAGENTWNDVALLIVIGRTEPSPRTVERQARALFGAEVQELEADAAGAVRYPRTTRGIRMRDGRGIAVEGTRHPDPRVEAVRWAICEAGLVQAIGRGRGVNRTASKPLQIDILTNVVLPLEVDEVTTWERIQPGAAQVMAAEGAVPLTYPDMAAAYPELFVSADAARMAITREAKNPEQTPIETSGLLAKNPEQSPIGAAGRLAKNSEQMPIGGGGPSRRNPEQTPISYLLGVCSGFLRQQYRRHGARGPASTLLYDPARIDSREWLRDHLGEVVLLPPAEGQGQAVEASAPLAAVRAESVRCDRTDGSSSSSQVEKQLASGVGLRAAELGPANRSDAEEARAAPVEQDGGGMPGARAGGVALPDGWSPADWEALYGEHARIAELDGGLPRLKAAAFAYACCEFEWLNRNFVSSPPGRCVVCDGDDRFDDPLLPCCGTGTTGHAWVHSQCWPAWQVEGKAKALAALAAVGIVAPPLESAENFGESGT
jgi:hypothetical protein